MGSRVLQYSFLGGEIAPAMLGRMDNALYQQGACRIENFVVEPTGALLSRPGFKYVGQAETDGAVRLIPFRFSSEQTLVLVFTDHKMRIVTEGQWLLDGGKVYEAESPYAGEDLFDLDYSQTADIITITCTKYPPKELRRYGATEWKFESVTTMPSILPPSVVTVVANYPEKTEAEDKGIVTVRYKVTAIDAEGRESVASEVTEAKCNYWLTGAFNTVSWSASTGAERYRVYRDVAGVYGFIGETESTSISDQGDFTPDTTMTPPLYANPFLDKTGIKAVEVLDGGSGYPDASEALNSATPSYLDLRLPMLVCNSRSAFAVWPSTELASANVTFKIVDGKSGTTAASCTIKYVSVAVKSSSSQGRSVTITLLLPENFANTGCRTQLNFGGYSLPNPHLKVDLPDGCFFLESFADTGYSASGKGSRPGGTSGTEVTYEWSVYVEPLPYDGWSFRNGMNAELFGLCAGWRLNSNTAGIEVEQGRGVPIGEILKETDESLDKIIEENSVQIEVSDPTGEGAVLQAVVQDGVISSVNVINSGANYTNPTLTVTSKKGAGAKLKAILFEQNDYDYPAANTQYDQRRIFAGTNANPLRVWMTNAGQQDLMMYHFPVLADDRIELTAVTSDADMIRHAVALDSLLLFTGSGELRVYTQNSDALTPDSVAVRAQSYVGANNVQPVIANSSVLFAANRGGHVRAVQYTYTTSGYQCTDLSMAACHLFDGKTIKDLALMKSPSQIVWAVSSDGSLLGLTFTPEQNIAAWHHHKTDGEFESICVVTEGNEDHLYAVIARKAQGQVRRFLERMSDFVITDEADARLLDSYIESAGSRARAAELTGLEHLEGRTVKAFVDGKDLGEFVVKNGSITVPQGGDKIAVGLPYVCSLITVPLASNAQGGLQGSVKNVGEIYLRVKYSGDIWGNAYPKNKLYLCKRFDNEFDNQAQESKMVRVSSEGSWDYQGQIQIEHRDCLPLEIQAVIGNVNVEGSR